MKSLACSYIWWPGLDGDIEQKVKSCHPCQQHRNNPPPSPLIQWEYPQRPWERLHADFAGPYKGRMFLVVVDAFSKWMEVIPLTTATSATTIDALRVMFSTHGIPQVFVTDNGTQFTSAEFMEDNGISVQLLTIRQQTGWPKVQYSSSRGVWRRPRTIVTRVSRFLFLYRHTPHTTTGVPPAELLLGRIPRLHLDLMSHIV